MNITVLVKPVPYKSIVDEDGNVVRNKIKNIINKNDKCAIEEALKIKERTKGKVSSISMSVKSNIKVLKDILAYGVDEAILLNDNIFAGSDTNATAYILSQAIKRTKSDLIICGKISSDSATSQVGIGVASKLNIPFLYNVCEIIEISDERIKCKIINGKYNEIIESELPCLVIVNDSINIPRIPTINNRLMAENKEIIIWDSSNIGAEKLKCGFNGSVTNVVGLTSLSTYKDVNVLKGTIDEKIRKLIEITKESTNYEEAFSKFEIKLKNSELEYWIYDNDFDSTCSLIAKSYKLAKKTNAKIVVVTFDDINSEYLNFGADKLIRIDLVNKDYINKALSLEKFLKERNPEIFLFNKTNEGKILSAYLSSKLNLGLSADCIKLELDENNRLIQIRSAYGGTMLASIVSKNCITQMATVLPDNEKLIYNGEANGEVENIVSDVINTDIQILEKKEIKENYLDKDIIIACGVGAIKQLDNLMKIANLINASLGITRDVYDKGYLDSNYLIGQSGKITNSKVYLVFGISGAVEHIVGINSDILISINNDLNAPILKISDYFINEDVNEFIPLLLNKLKEEK